LVERLEQVVQERHPVERGLLLLLDHDRYGRNRPQYCNGFCPDLFASDLPTTFEVIGEAKTGADLCRPRARQQIAAFLDYLSWRQSAFFYLCVPLLVVPRASFLLSQLRQPAHERIHVQVIPDV
jgi:hypothetical protein